MGVTTAHLPPPTHDDDDSGRQPDTDGHDGRLPSPRTPGSSQKPAFASFHPGRVCATPRSVRDLQRRRVESCPPPGLFSHPPQRQRFPGGSDAGASVRLTRIQMDSPVAHHVNNGNGSAGNLLSGGLGAAFPHLSAQEMQSASGGASAPSLPGFGTAWSVQTSSSPPPAPGSVSAIAQIPNADSDAGFYPGVPSSINPAFFQSFSANPCAGINAQGFGGAFSPQINVPQPPQSRRSPVSPQLHPQPGGFLQQRNSYNQHQV